MIATQLANEWRDYAAEAWHLRSVLTTPGVRMLTGGLLKRLTTRGAGKSSDMATDIEIDRALHAIATTVNDQRLDEYDPARVQEIVDGAVEGSLTVDQGGGIHDESGARIGVLRRTPSGEWIVERQNEQADGADSEVPEGTQG
jgi:hypothetical protein